MKAGFDFHGVLDAEPERFALFIEFLMFQGHEVHIITGHEETQEFRGRLISMGINWTHFFSIISYHKSIGTAITYDENGGPWMDKELWNRSKAEYCKNNSIDFLIDDSDIYGSYFTEELSTIYLRYSKGILKRVFKCFQETAMNKIVKGLMLCQKTEN